MAVVDTTGAGDTVNGALAAELAAGRPLREAAWFALKAAALDHEAGRAWRHADPGSSRIRVRRLPRAGGGRSARGRSRARRRGPGGWSRAGWSCVTSSSRCRTGLAALDGVRAGVMSDLHAGVPHAGLGKIAQAVDAMNALEPDVHLLLGDYLDSSQKWRRNLAPEAIAAELGACARRSGRSR